jgi:Ca2+-binding RTX toxin-like protein
LIEGGLGDDTITTHTPNGAVIYGDEHSDISGSNAPDGNDTIIAHNGWDRIYGQGGNDYIDGAVGNDKLYGGTGADTIIGGAGNDEIYSGDDWMSFGPINLSDQDEIYAGDGNDDVYINGQSTAYVETGAGNDYVHITGYNADHEVHMGSGNDHAHIIDGDASVLVTGGSGNDFFDAEDRSASGNLNWDGNTNQFVFNGNKIYMFGNDGNDTIIGSNGYDEMTGGTGVDIFDFNHGVNASNTVTSWGGYDIIKDFEVGVDKIDLSDLGIFNFQDVMDRTFIDTVTNEVVISLEYVATSSNWLNQTSQTSPFLQLAHTDGTETYYAGYAHTFLTGIILEGVTGSIVNDTLTFNTLTANDFIF